MTTERRFYGPSNMASFRAITTEELHSDAVVASCLDNQYIDRKTLLSQSFGFRSQYTRHVLSEFSKCLLSAEQIVVNRTYLQNTEVMQHLAPAEGQARADTPIIDLINMGVIVPYLYSDTDPSLKATVGSGVISENAASAWNRICERTEPRCLRLSWDEQEDEEARAEKLANRFSSRLAEVARAAGPDILYQLADRRYVPDVEGFQRFMNDALLPRTLDGMTRRQLYEDLVVETGSDVADTIIDTHKPFAREIKQLIDLVYNANMAAAIGVNNVTPSHALPADLLAEAGLRPAAGKSVSAECAATIVQRTLKLHRDSHLGTALPFLSNLSLEAVLEVRRHSSWVCYVRAVAAMRDVDTTSSEEAFVGAITEAFGRVLARSEDLCRYLYENHSARRQERTGRRALIAQVGGLCLGAAIGTAVGLPFPGTLAGSFAGNLVGGVLQPIVESPLRRLSMRLDLLGGTSASLRLPELKLDDGQRALDKFRRELGQMRVDAEPIAAGASEAPTIEADVEEV